MKKRMIIILSIRILCVGIIGAFIFWKQKQSSVASSTQTQTQNQPVEELAVWEDQAGFSFKYPKVLSFDKHDEDEVNYAHIEFTSATHPGKLLVWAKDTTYADVATWVAKDKSLQGSTSVDTTLGGEPAKKIIISTPSKKIIIGVISDQILFTIESEPTEDDPYWTTVSDTIASSFVFTPAPTDASAATTSSQDMGPSVDEEEVVE